MTGLRGRDALTADIVWENGELKEAVLTAPEDVEVCLDGAGCVFEMEGSAVEAKMDGRYQRILLKKDVPLKVRSVKVQN